MKTLLLVLLISAAVTSQASTRQEFKDRDATDLYKSALRVARDHYELKSASDAGMVVTFHRGPAGFHGELDCSVSVDKSSVDAKCSGGVGRKKTEEEVLRYIEQDSRKP